MWQIIQGWHVLASVLFLKNMAALSCPNCGTYGRCLEWSTTNSPVNSPLNSTANPPLNSRVNSTTNSIINSIINSPVNSPLNSTANPPLNSIVNSTLTCNKCACPSGINGTCCQNTPDPCNIDPCDLNEDCIVLNPFNFECQCSNGFTGTSCNDTLIDCSFASTPGPMDDQSFTQAMEDEWSSSTMINWWTASTPPWICQDCFGVSCLNNGTCSYNASNEALCQCSYGFVGDACEVKLPCTSKPCLNGGLCINLNETDYRCRCLSIYKGVNCQTFAPCVSSPCLNGTCADLGDGEFKCDCFPGFKGTFCEGVINMCDPNPCSQNATCTPLINDYECDCPQNSGGKNCSDITDFCQSQTYRTVCNANDSAAVCGYTYQNFTCICSDGWAGEYCNITKRVNDILPYFPNVTTATIRFLESVSNDTVLIQSALSYIAATLNNLADTTWRIDELIEWVAFERREINYTEEFEGFTDPSLGRCYTFNHPKSKTLFMLQDSGEDNGLSMMLNVQQNEYLETLEMAALKIFVHPYNQLIFRESLSFNAMPGASSTLKVSKSTYVSLGGNHGECAQTSKDVEIYYYIGNYSVDGCFWSCYQARLFSVCGCQDPRYQFRRRLRVCTLEQASCVFNFNLQIGDPVTWGVFCKCPPECTKVQYDVNWHGASFPLNPAECDPFTGTTYMNCLKDFQDKALVKVYFPDVTQWVYKEEPQWDVNTILSYFGGLTGCIMGFSIISILEFIYLVYRALLVMCTNERSTLDEIDIESISSGLDEEEEERKKELAVLQDEIKEDASESTA